jgi:hypothetical protein
MAKSICMSFCAFFYFLFLFPEHPVIIDFSVLISMVCYFATALS